MSEVAESPWGPADPPWIATPPQWTPTDDEYYLNPCLLGSGSVNQYYRSPEEFARSWSKRVEDVRHGRVTEARKMPQAMLLGSLVDCLLTEPAAFDRKFIVTPNNKLSHIDRHKVTPELYAKAHKLTEECKRHPVAGPIMTGPGLSQMCHFWEREGLFYRGKMDRVTNPPPGLMITDLKCLAVDVREVELAKWRAEQLGAFRQLSLYGQATEDLWDISPLLVLVILSTTTGGVLVAHVNGAAQERATREVEAAQAGLTKSFSTCSFSDNVQTEIVSFGT